MPTTFSLCFPLAANSAVIVSPIFQPFVGRRGLRRPRRRPCRGRRPSPPRRSRFMTSSALVGSTAEKLPSALSKRAWPQPLAETSSTPSTSCDRVEHRRAEARAPGRSRWRRTGRRWSGPTRTSPNDAFSDEAKTPMLTTSVRPIIRAAAVAEVRRGLRVAFCFASSPGMPRSLSGVAIAAASGRTASGSATMTPTIAASSPSPKTFMPASSYSADTMPAAPAARTVETDDGALLRQLLGTRSRLPQSLDRQHLGGAAGRNQAGDDGDDGADQQRDPDGAGLDLQRGERQGEARPRPSAP